MVNFTIHSSGKRSLVFLNFLQSYLLTFISERYKQKKQSKVYHKCMAFYIKLFFISLANNYINRTFSNYITL